MILTFMFDKIRHSLKNRLPVAAIAGALCAFAFAPFYFFFAAIISVSIFYLLLDEDLKNRRNFLIGFFYGFGYFLAGNYWIAISLLVDAKKFAWLIPFALTLIPSALALYFASFSATYCLFIKRFRLSSTYQKVLSFTFFWVIFEILRSYLLTGFPWNLLGYIWMFNLPSAQLASIFGIYGLTILALLACLLPIFFITKLNRTDKIFALVLAALLIVNFLYGHFRINNQTLIQDYKTKLRLVQPNIKQEMKWDSRTKYQNFLKTIALTNSQDLRGVKAVIWSETSVPYPIDDNPELLDRLKLATPPDGILITGGLRIDYANEEKTEISKVWNSVFALDEKGVVATYDKHHLVPFGEYVPLQKFLPFIEKITDGAIGFSKGKGTQTIITQPFSFSPLVCYEAIFPDQMYAPQSRPQLLVNVTNDAWFGNSSGPYQHFDMARMRSIEQGISMARVANTGISAFIDPYGKVVESVNLNQPGIVDVNLIRNLEPTIYGSYGQKPLILLLATILLILLISNLKKNDSRKNNTN